MPMDERYVPTYPPLRPTTDGWVMVEEPPEFEREFSQFEPESTTMISSELHGKPQNIFAAVIQGLLNSPENYPSMDSQESESTDFYDYTVDDEPSYSSTLVGSPSNVRVQATSNSSAVIQWDFDDSNGGSDGFIVKYLHEPVLGEQGRDDTAHWRSQTVMDPKARHLEIVRLNAHKPYAFCVLAVKQSRLGQCSDPPITVDKLQPLHMVQNLHVQYKTSQSVALKWDYTGPQPVRFFVKQSGQKSYLNQDLVEKRLVAPGFENKVDGAERSFMWQNLRQYMDYTFQVGVVSLHDGTVFWPKEVKVRTDATGPPFVEPPVFLEARTLGTAQIQLRCASEEYGPISHYWIIVVPGNYSKDDVRIMDSAALERSTAALKPRLTIAPVAKKVKKAATDEDDSDDSEEFDAEKVKRALEDEVLEANDYIEQEVEVGRSDEDSGIEADSLEVLKPVKTKSRRYKRHTKRYVEKRSGNSLDGIYIAAQIDSQEMRAFVRDQRSFTLGDGNNWHGFLNHPLDADTEYGVMMRAFAKGESASRRPLEYRAPMQEPAAKLYTDSPLSNPFSTKATDGVGKGKSTSMWLLGPLVIVLVVVIIIGMLLCWRFRSNKKGTRNNRHGSIMKVALPSGGPFMNGVSESSKLLTDAYGRPINGYGDANGNGNHVMESSMVDMYPGIGNGQTIMGNQSNYPTVQLPLPINGSLPNQTNSTIARGPIPISELATHIDKLKMNNNLLFTQEFECIDGGQHFTWESSSLELNKPKNRYANVVAYDHSRVLLHPIDNVQGSDYINANYIDGYGRAQAYIATQGPLPETFGDFWRMVWEQRSSVIVMLTRLEERARIKCDQYWPTKGMANYGRITVKLMDTVELAHYTIRTLQLEHRDEKELREVKQLQYTAWPDHGVPDHPTPFLMFLKRVKALNSKESGPIISHCSAGIGRTGAFIAIDYMLDKLRRENVVDIFECVTTLRAQRSYMVQTDDQYIFIHDAVLDAAQSGSTEVPADKLYHHTQRLLQPPKPTDELQYNGLELEFMTLSTLRTLNSRCVTANLPVNRPKNRYPHVVPYDTTRVIIDPCGVEGGDYINASWIDGYFQRANYIATQAPMNGTVDDFWRMLWEKESCIVVMLTHLREMGREKCFEYWPIDQPVSVAETLYVEPIAEYNMPQYMLREFKVTDRHTGQTRTIRHFQFVEWPENGVPKSAVEFLDFVGQVHNTKRQFGDSGPITVHCSTGAGRTGVFIALATIMDRMSLEHVVDVFTTVKLLRTERQNMVEEKDEYQFVYTAALEYLVNYDRNYE
uniref:protein-tyrosine-phosphatase n=1 Tax=Panagrellus redivivus TaxID=6233 RepID=A0A7E4UZT9_PANRE